MKVSILAALLAVVCALGGAHAQNGQIAILAPLEGRYGPLGKQISEAALSVLDAQSTQLIDTDCSAEGGLAAANSAVDQKISAVIGLPCIDAFDAAAPVLAKAGITIYAIGLQATNITSAPPRFIGDNWLVLRVGPIANMEAQILGTYLSQKWRGNPIALVDDGTLYGRQIVESVGVILEASENALIYRDSFRPLLDTQAALVRRLVRAQATRVVFGGDAADLAVVARDAQRLDADIAFAGGDPLFFAEPGAPAPDGTIVATPVSLPQLTRIAAQIALQADRDAPREYETEIGRIGFDETGEPDQTFIRLMEMRNGQWMEIQAGGASN